MAAVCFHCDTSLLGKRYVLREEMPTCLTCFEKKFANPCERCRQPIGTEHKDLSYNNKHWHDTCFLCAGCQNSLANQQFIPKADGIYCESCYENSFSARCDGCGQTFKVGSKRMEYKGKHYHNDCFACSKCRKPIGDSSFVPSGDNSRTCTKCYNDYVAQKCNTCQKAIIKAGVTYNEAVYHKECFVCKSCSKELANTQFAKKDDVPYCQQCYVSAFSKKCAQCKRPISGLGSSTKYCEFEGSHYHADCFTCSLCSISLTSKGFLVDDNNQIVCTTCGREDEEEGDTDDHLHKKSDFHRPSSKGSDAKPDFTRAVPPPRPPVPAPRRSAYQNS